MKTDVQITNSNGFYTLHFLSDRAQEWAMDNVHDQIMDAKMLFTDDSRCAMDIAEGILAAGFVVE